jgi:hypothetical protein
MRRYHQATAIMSAGPLHNRPAEESHAELDDLNRGWNPSTHSDLQIRNRRSGSRNAELQREELA